MRSRFRAQGAAACSLAALVFTGGAAADELPAPGVAYSADVTLRTDATDPEDHEVEGVGRIWYSDGKRRREMSIGEQDTLVIEREDLGVRWSRMPRSTLLFSELPIARPVRGSAPDPAQHWRRDLTLEKQGSEEVNGVQADRYGVKAKGGVGSAWLTQDKVPVRYEGTFQHGGRETKVRMDYTNIQVGAQDAALFELPEGVKPIPAMPVATHGPGIDRESVRDDLRKQAEEMREHYGK
jgi:hypothetical protein